VGLIFNLIVLLIVSLATRGLVERERVTTAEERVRTRATT
jgi:hypothetical protein